jgi:hypothetical protein
VYVVWLSNDPTFSTSSSITSNFKAPPDQTISGVKFYDFNLDGMQNPDEPGLTNWTIVITGILPNGTSFTDSTTTDASGAWSKVYPQGTVYSVCEILQPAPTGSWFQLGPRAEAMSINCTDSSTGAAIATGGCWSGTVGVFDECGLNFGNVLPGGSGGGLPQR